MTDHPEREDAPNTDEPRRGAGIPEGTDLADLREEIQSIDREIVELIARRTYVADTIARVKERKGLPTVDEHQEQQVMDRAGENADRFDVDSNLVKAVFRMLIELNKVEQRESRFGDEASGTLKAESGDGDDSESGTE